MQKQILTTIVIVGLFTGCKSFDPKFLSPTGNPFNPKLPSMERYIENNLVAIVTTTGQSVGASPQDVLTLFDREVSEIMTNPYGDKKGFLLLKVNTIENKLSVWQWIVSGTLMFTPTLLGLPLFSTKAVVEIQIDVMNNNRTLIGSYKGSSEKRMKSGLYIKDSYRELSRVCYLLAVKQAIEDAKSKMTPDLNRLVAELNK